MLAQSRYDIRIMYNQNYANYGATMNYTIYLIQLIFNDKNNRASRLIRKALRRNKKWMSQTRTMSTPQQTVICSDCYLLG